MRVAIRFLMTLFLLVGCSGETENGSTVESNQPVKVGELDINTGDILLGSVTDFEVQGDHFYWVESSKILICKNDGEIQNALRAGNRGPGEFIEIHAFNSQGDRFVIYDKKQQKMLVFADYGKFLLYEFKIDKGYRFKNIALSQDAIYCQIERELESTGVPILKFNLQGQTTELTGKIPKTAIIQSVRNGGGIFADPSGKVYYSYIGEADVWTAQKHQTKRLNLPKPNYFEAADLDDIKFKSRKPVDHIRYSFSISRVQGLYRYDNNQIAQAIETGNPWNDEPVQIYLRVIDEQEEATYPFDQRIADVTKNKVYVYQSTTGEFLEQQDKQERISVVDIYEL
jgi:hypothetical protein